MARRGPAAPIGAVPEVPTVAIYQNGDYVEGILQQVHGRPLLTDFSDESRTDQTDITEGVKTKNASGGAKVKAPILGEIEGKIGADYEKRLEAQTAIGSTATSTSRYTQAYYLYAARAALDAAGHIQKVATREHAANLRPGQFVQFTATFAPSQIIALLDIVTPNLVASITRQQVQAIEMAKFSGGDLEAAQKFKLMLDGKVQSAGELAQAITEALTIDFRSTKTREFYGHIGSGEQRVTAVTICDLAHFVVEDEDRILDGHFTVLGKITTAVENEVPVLARNKVLERFRPEAVDKLVAKINREVQGQTRRVIEHADSMLPAIDDPNDEVEDDPSDVDAGDAKDEGPVAGDLFDFNLDSRVHGPSFKVVPIAIYV